MRAEELLQFCPTCGQRLLYTLVNDGGDTFCPQHGIVVLRRVVERAATTTYKFEMHRVRGVDQT